MIMHTIFPRLSLSPIARRAAAALVVLVALAWGSPAFCGEIHDAVRRGKLEQVKALLKDHPGLVLSKDDLGRTPLHIAAFFGRKDAAELLLADGADVNARDNGGKTPLHWAAQLGHKDVAELLLASQADVNAKAKNGSTPSDLAASQGHTDVAELLRHYSSQEPPANAPDGAVVAGTNPPAAQRSPAQQSVLKPEDFLAIDRIVILPVLDSRPDKKAKVDLQYMRKRTQKILVEWKHYAAIQADSPPPGARWVMVITLTGLGGRVPTAAVVGSLCDKESATSTPGCQGFGGERWYGTAIGSYTSAQGGIQGPAMEQRTAANLTDVFFLLTGTARKWALENALSNLLDGIPGLPDPKKKKK